MKKIKREKELKTLQLTDFKKLQLMNTTINLSSVFITVITMSIIGDTGPHLVLIYVILIPLMIMMNIAVYLYASRIEGATRVCKKCGKITTSKFCPDCGEQTTN